MTRLALVGTGVMGEAVLSGLLAAGWSACDVVISERYQARREEVSRRHGVAAAELSDAVAEAETVLVAVKPQDFEGVVRQVGESLRPGSLVVSIAAGLTTATLESWLPPGTPVVRVMPNTPAQVSAGMSALSAGSAAGADHLVRAEELMQAVGKVVVVAEKDQDAVTAASGSGPAYLFYLAEAMIDAAVLLGLARPVATELVVETLLGSARLLAETGEHPTVLRERVTSPGGTTAVAIRQLDDHKVKAALIAAMEAARDRSRELAGS